MIWTEKISVLLLTMPNDDNFSNYAAELERVMQTAVQEAEALQSAAKADIEQAADIRIEMQAFLNQLDREALAEAESKASELANHIRHTLMQKIIKP